MPDNLLTPLHLILVLFAVALFFIPTLIAGGRQAEHDYFVAGGTGIGWVVVLVWALYDRLRLLPVQAAR